jgi:hypothetical protein
LAGTLLLLPMPAAADVHLTIAATDPEPPATLGHWEQFSLRVAYETDRPIRVRGDALAAGRKITAMTSGAALHAAGTGEALFWFAFTSPAHVDAIVIRAEDTRGATVASLDVPVDLTWTGVRADPLRARAAWVTRMQEEETRRIRDDVRAAPNGPDGQAGMALGLVLMCGVPLYFLVQPLMLWKLRGGWRAAAALPLVPMAGVLVYTVIAYNAGSNIFPLVLIFTAPIGLGYLLVLALAKQVAG